MKVRVIETQREKAPCTTRDLLPGKVYNVEKISPNFKWYNIIDECGDMYSYPPELFEVVEE